MKVSDFDFELPEKLIAQSPMDKRDNSKLLVLDSNDGSIKHRHFYNIIDYLSSNDVLVLNETKVIPARLFGVKAKTDAKIEILLLKEIEKNLWEALVKPARRIKENDVIEFNGKLKAVCTKVKDEGIRHFKMVYEGVFIEILDQLGSMPLPPYITKQLAEKNRYQTVYAKDSGSAAAPTAGLHFTVDLLEQIRDKGVEIIPITLHVGLGTFRPVSVDKVEDHQMHSESYYISPEAAKSLNNAVAAKKNIIAVGTTSIRTLESNFNGKFSAGFSDTNIFIYPGYQFKVVNSLITNFHLPKSSLIMLISAFSNYQTIMTAYQEAIKHEYRFFSFGDAMFIRNGGKK